MIPTSASASVAEALAKHAAGKSLREKPAATTTTTTKPTHKPTTGTKYPRPNGTDYYARKVNGTEVTDVEFLRASRGTTIADNLYVMLFGEPGTGKSALVEAAFPDLITIDGNGSVDIDDFVGSWVQMPDGTYQWQDGPLVTAMEQGRPLFIDEIAQISDRVLVKIYPAMDGRGAINVTTNPLRGTVHAKPGFYVVGACNPNAPGSNMSEALLSRFTSKIEATTDYDLCSALGVMPTAIKVAKNLAKQVRSGELTWAPQMRELLAHRDTTARLGEDAAWGNMVASAMLTSPADVMEVARVISIATNKPAEPLRQGVQA